MDEGEEKTGVSGVKEVLEPMRVLEAALFLANKPLLLKNLSEVADVKEAECRSLLTELARTYEEGRNAFEIVVEEDAALLRVRGDYLESVAALSNKIDLTRKATRILALIAKKKTLMQKELHQYFRGEIYAYVSELKEAGYLEAKKQGNTRLLKPTRKFFEEFRLSETG